MSKLRVLSGQDVIRIFQTLGFSVAGQKGSHVKLVKISEGGSRQTLTIPNHEELDKGTLKAIYNQAGRYISENDLKEYFYSE